MTLGYLIYTVSLQSKSLKKIEDSLKDITQQLKNQNKDIEKLKTNK
jgi:hypothetical protein